MMEIAMLAIFVAGVVLVSRTGRVGEQCTGFGLLLALLFVAASPARADQTVMVEDNSRVECIASQKDLTRVSLYQKFSQAMRLMIFRW